jgi:Putative Zn-dependent protease, contains TPR repeats
MKKLFLFFTLFSALNSIAQQPQDSKELQENAKAYMRQGDYDNAALLLTKALEQSPSDLSIAKDLALNYYFQKENTKALETIKPFLDRPDVDDQSFQIAGNIYKQLDQSKEAEALYKKGIKKFYKSGALYNEYGELLSYMQNPSAISQWEKGIEMDPGYSGNYYNAAKYYYFTTDKIWSIIYAEIFINIEPLSARTVEVKSLLLDSYKKLFSGVLLKNMEGKNNFEKAFIESMNKANEVAQNGINAETLTMIRTRFILDWYEKYAAKYPFKLFEYHQQLLRDGLFPAYNQWIFGATENLMGYQTWTTEHAAEYNDFSNFQKGRLFKVPAGQYYHK